MADHDVSTGRARRLLMPLLVGATFLFTANTHKLSLPSLDDCFYARKGIEMLQRGASFEVTFNYQPGFQNPPLPFWLLALSFGVVGQNDLAARLPAVLMALGILMGTYWIGEKTVGSHASLVGTSLLLLTPFFVNNARRCMLEIPLTFWLVVASVLFLQGIRKPPFHLLVAVPLAAAMLTKSVLGLIPFLVLIGTLALSPELRRTLDQKWLWAGMSLGVLLGLSWSLYLALGHGRGALVEHYVKEILSRSSAHSSLGQFFLDYPRVLLSDFHLVVLPGLLGALRLWSKRDLPNWKVAFLLVWIIGFPVILNFASSRTARYIFPVVPALAVSGGYWLHHHFQRLSRHLYLWFVPLLSTFAAAIFWIHPSVLSRDRNAVLKNHAPLIRRLVPRDQAVGYLGDQYWAVANPLLYYADRELALPSPSPSTWVSRMVETSPRFVFCDRRYLTELRNTHASFEVILESEQWFFLHIQID